ncbi:MAG: adenylate kinase [Nitrosopumilus sp.]|nr:adenylate kinase [Nitrosopumilus sp.]MDA7945440.1 adenylate kinase [Nitrosopumilus sp.]MDA7955398.1 adenylate kinase [Nitrosopumilus sp.]MDA7974360.1 adenylate kinase [Nitrosopumilus sp.]MDA7997599.1 adenylate kinase [Nitrosopumilus sp.]
MRYLAENKVVVIVGIPGVGKTTLLSRIEEAVRGRDRSVCVVSFGTLMLEAAREGDGGDRDGLRRMPVSEQRRLQEEAARRISSRDEEVVIVDTHAFVSSPEGYYPGLPEHVLRIIRPTNFVSVSAKPEEIYNRRMGDPSRKRDKITIPNIKKELDIQSGMISACSVLTGCPVKHVLNVEGKAEEATERIMGAIGL